MDGVTADMMNALIGLGPGGIAAGIWFYLWRSRGAELETSRAETAVARQKVDDLQVKIQNILQSQIEGEPQRRETLAAIGRSVADTNSMLKDKLSWQNGKA